MHEVGYEAPDLMSGKLCDLVYSKIAARIRVGDYPVDSRLPTENELAEMLSVSRPVVREALARLRNDGLIVSRRGSGTYVQRSARPSEIKDVPLHSIADMEKCFEFRISLESEAAFYAGNGPADRREPLYAAWRQIEKDHESGTYEPNTDFAFHSAVAESSGNRFFAKALLELRSSIETTMILMPTFVSDMTRNRFVLVYNEHKAVYDAILNNDGEGARQAMRRHLVNSMRRIFDGFTE